ncbi:putative Periodic tryptophan protein 2 [Trypanosoma cruzi]|uniref:Periodic tryptophan protein 2, putative n=2 Tax=Trypanosoma cruzi TaxID=5693 RepID=Q4DY14_TRYCC|nr:periodic tryptophan protein 2, putative [Trypanosoma cruzi]EAN97421.1 periodic tryptophan protein 2, putative [Trypanosoma cruzi]KAF8292591.1 putative periodic tryptophan protein 2 [Trypanosoma cruzi]PWU89441.1 putative Periodic tryptophan protein 2 [Trypanosoma cruzi]RNC59947.1 periodic tryptophan protein 2-like protein [Trypanosoma cruzi]|eukprot:XP_819272.1 periodic tryptophan protein 2 [Trypanosoma cruzi strain CL Brener]
MQTNFQLASVHGMLYTGGNVAFSPDGRQLYSPVNNYISSIQVQQEGHRSLPCSNSTIQCFDLSPDGDLLIAIGRRGVGFFYAISAGVVLDTIAFPPDCEVRCVKFSPCGKYVAIALENTLQVYTSPAQRVVAYHACHRVENLHAALTLPIMNVEWSPNSEHLLLCGQDARMKIYPRQGRLQQKGMAIQQNALVGHRAGVHGAWFMDDACSCVVSVSADNVIITWKRTNVTRREVLQAVATAQMKARIMQQEDESGDDDDDGAGRAPKSFLEKRRLEQLKLEGVRVSVADDTYLPDILRCAYEIDKKYLLTHKGNVSVTCFHRLRGLVAIGYNSGIFAIHSLTTADEAELTLVHLLSISAQSLTAAAFSPTGDFVAFGSAQLKQLLLWDWKSEAYVLKDQAHYYDISRVAITADSGSIISCGDDGKIKVWKASSGQCYVTFTEHTAPVTGVVTCAATNAFFTCSRDGTARGYDLVRYRHFRVYKTPEQTQLSCIAVDPSGEVLAVGSGQTDRIFLFAVQTGKLIDQLQGHEAPIACLAFHPSGTALVSGSLDHNLVFWDLFNRGDGGDRMKGDAEVVDIGSEVLSVTFSNSGRRLAVLTMRQEISVYETVVPTEPIIIKTFQTSFDAAGGWNKTVGPRSANYNARFNVIAFSPEGEKIVAGGDSKWIVMYHATQGYMLKKWPVTTNQDVQGAEEQYQWRQMTEAGHVDDIDVDDADIHLRRGKIMEMPGSRHRHFATGKRQTALTARTMDLAFSCTGTEFVAATTDGLLVFSTRVARPKFQPLQLSANITTQQVRDQLDRGEPVMALMGAMKLGDKMLGVECLRRMPRDAIPVAVSSAPSVLFPLLVQWVSTEVEESRGIEQALLWAQSLMLHSNECTGGFAQERSAVIPALKVLQRGLQQHRALTDLAKENYFSLRYIIDMTKMQKDILQPAATVE